MKRNTTLSVSICLLLLSGLAQAGEAVPFKATFHGYAAGATALPSGLVEVIVPLQGTATHLGKFDERLVHYIDLSTGMFSGYAEWTAANGDTLTTVFEGQLSPTDDPNWLTFEVTHVVVEGTGRFQRAEGAFKGINGFYNRVTGEDFGGYVGTLSY